MDISSDVETRIRDAPVSAHLATSVDDRPHVAPVWYGYRDGNVYFITGGRKLENIRQNDQVSLSIEQAAGGDVDWNVTLLGRATVTTDPERIEWAEGWVYDRYEAPEAEDDDDADSGGDGDSEEATAEDAGGNDADDESGPEAEDWEYALVEVRIGSTSLAVYD